MTPDPIPLLEKMLEDRLLGWTIAHEELSVTLLPDGILGALNLLKGHKSLLYTQLMDICVVDYLEKRTARFEVVYHLLSLVHNSRIRLKVPLDEDESIASATSFFACADWWEREAYDMFGVRFESHPNLERILTDDSFEGFPLRKDFPLTGHVQVRYDNNTQKIVQEPVSLEQAYRSFETTNPWQGYPKEPPS